MNSSNKNNINDDDANDDENNNSYVMLNTRKNVHEVKYIALKSHQRRKQEAGSLP